MKKIISAVLAAAIILAAAGCSNGSTDPANTTAAATTTAATDSNGKVTEVAYEASIPDTSEAALEYLETVAPLFKKYITKRREAPLSFESVITNSQGEWKSNIYIKDEHNVIQSVIDPTGVETRTVYSVDKGFQLDTVNKKVYIQNFTTDRLDSIVAALRIRLMESDVKAAEYGRGSGIIDGVEYDCETITISGDTTEYYFSDLTGDLMYIKNGDTMTKITKLENTFDKDDMLTIPADYEQLTYEDLLAAEGSD